MELFDKILICHCSALKERKQHLQDQLKNFTITPIEWIESHSVEELANTYDQLLSPADDNIIVNCLYNPYQSKHKKINIRELSLYLKHVECIKILEKEQLKNILILEDDVMLPDNFIEYVQALNEELVQSKITFDIIELGGYENYKAIGASERKRIYTHPQFFTRCTHAYTVNARNVSIILEDLKLINNPIDFRLNAIIAKRKLRIGWIEPGLKQNKHFTSTLR